MLRDPPQGGKREEVRKDCKKRRFQIDKLEERIAPRGPGKLHGGGPPGGHGRCYNGTGNDGCY